MIRTPFRHVAPAGAPIGVKDLFRWTARMVRPGNPSAELAEAFCRLVGIRHCRVTSTGRAGLTLLLRAFVRMAPSERDEVIVPSYTCFSVPASVVKAGLRPRIVDIDPATLDFDAGGLERTDFSRVLALVATNLYGVPNDLPRLVDITRRHGVYLIDDAAQALGASVGGRLSGTWGDAGLYSLDRGKNVSAISGGVIVTDSQALAAALDIELKDLPSPGATGSAGAIAKAFFYWLFLRPSLYWIPNSIPALGLGSTVFATDFPLERPNRPLAMLGLTMLAHLTEFTARRRANAAALLSAVDAAPGWTALRPAPSATPAYVRFPFLVRSGPEREQVIGAMQRAGIGATISYPASIADLPELREYPSDARGGSSGGREVARRIVTLPTHPLVDRSDVARMTDVLAAYADDANVSVPCPSSR